MIGKSLKAVGCLLVVASLLGSCGKPPPAPATQISEQKRAEVAAYLLAFDGIQNEFVSTASAIAFPPALATAADFQGWSAAAASLQTAIDRAMGLLEQLKTSSLEPSTATHLQQAREGYQQQRTILKALQDAVTAGNGAQVAQKWAQLRVAAVLAVSLNRSTELLISQYSIEDMEVDYQFRGVTTSYLTLASVTVVPEVPPPTTSTPTQATTTVAPPADASGPQEVTFNARWCRRQGN